jgi:hypothetical protein
MVPIFLLAMLICTIILAIYFFYPDLWDTIIYSLGFKPVTEPFKNFQDYRGVYCKTCPDKDATQCSLCVNCGYGVDWNGYGRCTDGDASGPYFSEDIVSWNYRIPELESWYWPSWLGVFWNPWENYYNTLPYTSPYAYGYPYRGVGRDVYRYPTPSYISSSYRSPRHASSARQHDRMHSSSDRHLSSERHSSSSGQHGGRR